MSVVTAAVPPAEADPQGANLGTYARNYAARVRGGEMGSLPAILGLIVLVVVFSILRPRFLTALNFANLFQQGSAVVVIAMGLVFVLLLGEIDLSAGFASGVCAAVLAITLTNHHWPRYAAVLEPMLTGSWYAAVLAAMVTGLSIGTVLGLLVAKVGIPSFVVTLAAFLAFQGVNLLLLKDGTIVSVQDKTILLIDFSGKLPPVWGWILLVLTVGVFGLVQVMRRTRRLSNGLAADPMSVVIVRVGTMLLVLGAMVYVLNLNRAINPLLFTQEGVPVIIPIIGVLLIIWTFVLSRTAYGRHLYAVGGNQEAARRAGINVDTIRISAFVICSSMAAIGGIIAASRANSVDPNTGGSNVLLDAVGAAVIGGTSLFGGKGRVLDAILGGAIIAVIQNGMGLLGYKSGIQFVVTGIVLLLAASVDALSRRRASTAGLR